MRISRGAIRNVTKPEKIAAARFRRLASGREPVRERLGGLLREHRRLIGRHLMRVESCWPSAPPLCASLTGIPGLLELRSNLAGRRVARVFFTSSGRHRVLIHGSIKKTQSTPKRELRLATQRMKEYERHG